MGFIAPGISYVRPSNGRKSVHVVKFKSRQVAVPIDRSKVRRARRLKLPLEHSDSVLERLPHDILWEIFLLAGIDNNLPLASKYFMRVLIAPSLGDIATESSNRWLFIQVLDRCLLQDLNVHVDEDWVEKYHAAASGIEAPSELVKKLISVQSEIPTSIYQNRFAIDVDAFSRGFMNDSALHIILERYPAVGVMSSEQITNQIENRQKFIEWNYRILMEAIKKAQQADEGASEYSVIDDVKNLKELKANTVYLELAPRAEIPNYLYSSLNHSKAVMIKNLIRNCGCILTNEVAFTATCFKKLPRECFSEYVAFEPQQVTYTFADFELLIECIVTSEREESSKHHIEQHLQLLYERAENALSKYIIEDHNRLRDLAWLTSRVQRGRLQHLLSEKSLETL
ncbi:hypothetical protein CJI97_003450 [Candidozyma auris]|uniref:Uncharacterized protein n=2 Tax=Candidozyma auris TaxID=498019 RepID=A0A2H0ZMD0_CANAR|nr:hypothetical protein B9J08_003375 [[Candida] auris]PIS53764.1 hypothetical protein CJI97_003450 [[Candida] auris]